MDEREKLYDKFVASGGNPSIFFDEIDLVDIFDFATDCSDDGTRIKVIILAERMYPESVELNERRALLFYDLNDFGEVSRIIKKLPSNSFRGKLVWFKLQILDKETIKRELERLIESFDEFEDEWIIQLIDYAEEKGLYDWLIDNKKLITSKTSYPQTYLYEMVNLAMERLDSVNALKLAEELTELEPFNNEFWEILSDIHTNMFDDPVEGEKAIDYALAINPDSLKSLLQKSRILGELDKPIDEILPYLNRAIEIDPDLSEPVIAKALYTASLGNLDSGISILNRFYKKHPENLNVIEYLVKITDGNIGTDVFSEAFGKDNAPEEGEIINMAITCYFDKSFNVAATLLKAYDRYVGLSYKLEPFEIFYRNGDYNEIISLYERLNGDHNALVTAIDLIYVLSRLRSGRLEGLREKVNEYKRFLELPPSIYIALDDQLEGKTIYKYLESISKLLETDRPIDVDLIDPFMVVRGMDLN